MKSVAEAYKDFPILQRTHNGHPLVYLDSGATTQVPNAVIDALEKHLKNHNGNPHRGAHVLAVEASEAYETARDTVQRFINAKSREEIVLTRNTTESLNLIAFSYGMNNVKKGDKIVITIAEHHANLVTWQRVAQVTGATLEYMYLDESGHIKDGEMDKIDEHTKIVAFAHVSNVLGMEFPVAELIKRAHDVGAVVVLDGAQSTPHKKIDVQALDCDFYAFSGHKLFGPTGIGVLYGKRALLEAMPPFLGGGDMVDTVTFAKTTYAPVPLKFEAGTANFTGAIALGEAVKFVGRFDPAEVEAHEAALLHRATERLTAVDGLRIYGTTPGKCAIVSFNVEGVHPYDMGMILDKLGIAVRTGQHCAEPTMTHFSTTGMCRASFALYNTLAEADALAGGVERAVRMLRG